MNNNNISIRDIAELAGTSVATVSRVINKNGRFSKETEEKVLRIIKEYNYHPNNLAKALRQDRLKAVGVVVPDITNEYFSGIVRAIEAELIKHGYLTVLCDTGEHDDVEEKYIEMINNMRFAGVIYIGGSADNDLNPDMPVVYVDRQPKNNSEGSICFIGSDNEQGGYLAGRRLIDAGRKSLAVVLYRKDIETQDKRYKGFMRAIKEAGGSVAAGIYYVDNVNYEHGYDITKDIISGDTGIDGIFYTSDILAAGGIRCLKDRGISVPDDISVIGMDGIPEGERTDPRLTTVRQQYPEFGRLAADSVIKMIDGVDQESRIFDVEITERDSI